MALAKEQPAYHWFRCIAPSWDNSGRRRKKAFILRDSNPQAYRHCLCTAGEYTMARYSGDEALLFLNAWNEWAEGNHLEPDQKWGRGYLEATKEVLDELQSAAAVR